MKGSSFKIKQTVKRVACTFTDAHERGEYIRIMMDAQKSAEKFANSRRRDKPEVIDTTGGE